MRSVLLAACLALGVGVSLPALAQDAPETSPEALEAHARGLRAYLAQDYQGAIPHFLRAHELDPTFVLPLYQASIVAGNAGMLAMRDSLWDLVLANRDRFSDYYQRQIDAFQAGRASDWTRREELESALVRDYPGTKAAYLLGLWGLGYNHARIARDALLSLDPDKEPMRGWYPYFSVLADAHHALGDTEAELATARAGYERFPDLVSACSQLADALASTGRTQELERVVAECGGLKNTAGGWNMAAVYSWAGAELLAHGDAKSAQPYLDKAVAWYEKLPADQRQTDANRRNYAYTLYAAGRYAEAQKQYQALVGGSPGGVADRGRLGASAALAGDERTARESLRMIEAGEVKASEPTLHGYASFITAALGDTDATLKHLQQTWPGARWVHVEPAFLRTSIKKDPRFQEAMKPTG